MQTVGIAIDAWKLPIFEKRLKAEGYTFEQHQMTHGPHGLLLLKIKTDKSADELKPLIESINTEARKTKGN